MNFTIENAKKYVQNSRDIKNGMAKFFREVSQPMRSELDKIRKDSHLTAEGKEVKLKEKRVENSFNVIEKVHHRQQQYVSELTKANMIADKIAHTPKKKPDAETLKRFEQSFKELKTQIKLTPRTKVAEQRLNDFIAKIKDPYLADMVRDDFQEIAESIIESAGSESIKYKHSLAKTYESLREDFESQDVKDAKEILEYTEQTLEDPKLFYNAERSLYDGTSQDIMGDYGKYLYDTEAFYTNEGFESLKPEPYQDEELEAKRKQDEHSEKWDRMNENMSRIMKEKIESGELNLGAAK